MFFESEICLSFSIYSHTLAIVFIEGYIRFFYRKLQENLRKTLIKFLIKIIIV